MLHHLMGCRFLVVFHPSAFERLWIPSLSHLNHKCKVLIELQLGLHIERDGPHIPCNHAKKPKDVAKGELNKCWPRNLRCVLQIRLELIAFQGNVPFRPCNYFMFVITKLGHRVTQDAHIHGCMLLMPSAFFLNKWVFGLAHLHGHIMACSQMFNQIVFGYIGCIAPIKLVNKFGPIPFPMHTVYGNWRKGNRISN